MECPKILIDTNVVLDVLCAREGFVEHSAAVWKLCEAEKTEGVISALSIANIIYILRKQLDPEKTKDLITKLSQIFEIADLRSSDLKAAAEMSAPDYEDALQMCCAKRGGAEYIITRDKSHFDNSPVTAVSPQEFLALLS